MSAQPVTVDATVTRQALRYYGSKWSLAEWIISHFPPHASYVEPYGGSAAVLLAKEPSRLETYNDLDGDVVTFFRVLRDRPDELVRAVELTPFAHAEFNLARQPATDDLDVARRVYVRSWQERGAGRGKWRAGWRRSLDPDACKAIDDWRHLEHLYAIASRLRRVQIEQDDALNVIRRYDRPDALFLVDPPYVTETRGRWKDNGYSVEMDEAAHCQLANAMHSIKGMAIVCGYDSRLYQELYAGWPAVTRSAVANGGGSRVECLWLNPAAAAGGQQPRLLEV